MHTHIQERISKIQHGEVPEGYQKTKVGVIPSEWEVKKLGGIATVLTGNTPSTKDRDNYGDEYFFVSPADLGKGKYILNSTKKLSQKGFNLSKKLPPNSILFTCIGSTIGKSGIAPFALTCNQQINAILPSRKFSSDFLFYSLNSLAPQIKLLAGEQAVPIINKSEFEATKIQIPPLHEQQKIAEILSAWDDAIRLQHELIEQKTAQKRGLMQMLLSGKIRVTEMGTLSPDTIKKRVADIQQDIVPEGYQNTKLGIIPNDWEIEKFSGLFDFDGGFSFSRKEYSEKGICCLHYGDIHKSTKNFIDIEKEQDCIPKIDSDIKSFEDRKLLADGDIVFADASEDYDGIGKSVVIFNEKKVPFIPGLHTIVAKSQEGRDDVYRDYKRFFLLHPSVKKQFCFFTTGISVFGISKSNIKKVTTPLPPLPEQQKIADILTTADKEIELLETELAQLQGQKKGLMQLLLSGKIRVHEVQERGMEKIL